MVVADKPADQWHTLHRYGLLDGETDSVLETIIRAAADVCGVDIAVIALTESERQYLIVSNSLKLKELPRAKSFCANALLEPENPFEIPDASKDTRSIDNPVITGDGGVRFYAVQPLIAPQGCVIGGLCLIATQPRELDETQCKGLRHFAGIIVEHLETRKSAGPPTSSHPGKESAQEGKTVNDWIANAVSNISQGLAVYDDQQCLVLCNSRYAKFYDLPLSLTRPGTTLRQIVEYCVEAGIFGDSDAEDYIEKRIEWSRVGTARSTVSQINDGTWILKKFQPLPGGGWVSTHEDITEQMKAKKALQQSEELFSKAFHANPSLVTLSTPHDGQHFDVNQTWVETMGYTREEAMAQSAVEMGIWVDNEERCRFVEKLRTEKSVRGFEGRLRTKNGRVIHCLISGEYLHVGGEPRLLIASNDITERKKAEALNQRLAKIVEDSINEVFVFDAETLKFLQVNKSACENLGYTVEEMADLTPLDIKPELDREQFEAKIAILRNGTADHIRFQTVHRRKDGSLYDVDVILQQISSEDRPVFAAIAEDITERRKTERELIDHRDHLQQLVDSATRELKAQAIELQDALEKEKELNDMQRQFVAMASHEFRTPLAIIDMTAQRMKKRVEQDRLVPEDIVHRVGKIRHAVRRMTRLMESTLTAARIEEGIISIELDDCDIAEVVRDVCTRQQEVAGTHSITCKLAELPRTIRADTHSIDLILTNLLSNAVKYAPDAPDIEITAQQVHDFVEISVRDHGFGIDAEDLKRIGERFFRAKSSTGIAGTGIGLSLVRMLVDQHGGSMKIESRPGEGSTFTISLPIAGPGLSREADPGEVTSAA